MVEESGFVFTPPHEAWFRFADCGTYRTRLSGQGIKEMDFAYWDAPRDRLALLEIEDYTGREMKDHRVERLIAKGKDVLVMLHSAWHEVPSELGASLAREIPELLRVRSRVQIVFVLKLDGGTQRMAMSKMRDKIRRAIRAYAALLDMDGDAALMDQHQALEFGLPLRPSGAV
jgi:hypothetical protein